MKQSKMNKNIENPSAAFNTSWPKSLRGWWQDYHWSVILIGVVIVFVLG
ncbi:MAG: hypothetical protein JSV88_14045 [Candidatus Aminicenantes bacterium]|nr:MAG: hypothetical protein JSV88_14045 [Candidatus Aminicenantes bacterium]